MHTLLLRLAGPMQSWGVQSRFSERDTLPEPSKSGVLGLLCAALGVDRSVWDKPLNPSIPTLKQLSGLRMGVRVDREGTRAYDYQTAMGVMKSKDGKVDQRDNTVQSRRYYLADAVFLVGLEGEDLEMLQQAHAALRNPTWPLFLGRKGYVPSPSVWLKDGLKENTSLLAALVSYQYLLDQSHTRLTSPTPQKVRYEIEASEGKIRNDVPIDAFSKRQFGARLVYSRTQTWGEELKDVPL
ncbi:MAG: type I-E CRISPR-associated protein Cas5/CasD [Meiothermus sp.]|uniref:type I-E CRISPR-associated protein Cas5/CasD n=1 Tax=Meiothermus sp. TaxID=1955249 RepID=UPI0021DE5D84|nr:type I-E CRISPR-associated protein Cas5/CasD [Meiothermus sp.]GIW29392.1 MAG: type I-E CRISPR-associated protein Cas5/CasD [Meiothermus sp.]